MCNCVKDIEVRMLENFKSSDRYKKPVQAVSINDVGFPIVDGKLLMLTCSTLEVTIDGQKKKEKVNMFHSYCPFCGLKYEEAARRSGDIANPHP